MKDCPEHRLHKHLLDRHEKKIDLIMKRVHEIQGSQDQTSQMIESACKRLDRIESSIEEHGKRPSALVNTWKTAFIVAIASAIISVLLKIIDNS